MRKRSTGAFLIAAVVLLIATGIPAQREPTIPTPRGFVTDSAGVLSPSVIARLTALATELQAKTGAEIAVLTVDTTAPLDDFSYAMKVVDTWRPGRKRDDTGLLVLLAVKDRKLRVLTGYGLEGILPDGLVGQIEDEEMLPALRAGRIDEAIERGVREFAARIAADKGITLTGVPPPRVREEPPPDWVTLLVLLLVLGAFVYLASRGTRAGWRRRGGFLPGGYWGGGGFGGGGGGFGGGGGGFGGFGGGGFGGGGAGRSW
jgi:uncharacterized protein